MSSSHHLTIISLEQAKRVSLSGHQMYNISIFIYRILFLEAGQFSFILLGPSAATTLFHVYFFLNNYINLLLLQFYDETIYYYLRKL